KRGDLIGRVFRAQSFHNRVGYHAILDKSGDFRIRHVAKVVGAAVESDLFRHVLFLRCSSVAAASAKKAWKFRESTNCAPDSFGNNSDASSINLRSFISKSVVIAHPSRMQSV